MLQNMYYIYKVFPWQLPSDMQEHEVTSNQIFFHIFYIVTQQLISSFLQNNRVVRQRHICFRGVWNTEEEL